jgi:hypothetical protein
MTGKRTYFMKTALIIIVMVSLAISIACKRKISCNPDEGSVCPSGTICKSVAADKGQCLYTCEPDADNPCDRNEVCLRYADDAYACTPQCTPGRVNECPADWICVPVMGDEHVCRPECDLDSNLCEDNEVCQPLPDGGAACMAQCDPEGSDCGEQQVCELRTDGRYACYDPVYLRGTIFDSASASPVEGAHVIAIDKTGAAATDVAISGGAGEYELQVPVVRNPDGTLSEGTFTLRTAAPDYLPFPYGIRPAIPVDAATATPVDEVGWVLQNTSTEIALIILPEEKRDRGSISGSIVVDEDDVSAGGVLVVLEGATEDRTIGFSDKSGDYTLFNVPEGNWEIHGYKAFLQLDPAAVTLAAGEDKPGVDLIANDKSCGTVSGSINLVNAPGGSATSVVLVPESTFNETFVKGEVPPGLRAPSPPADPSITGAFTIEGVPDGRYVVLAAFENDILVRDPDPNIAGTQILHLQVPEGASYDITIASSFKVTEALVIVSPGASEPELITGTPEFVWRDDSSETRYALVVYNAFGEEVWKNDAIDRVTGAENVVVPYAGSPLQAGMYYQFRATSWRDTGPISQTEDLLGVFYTAGE